MHGDLLFGIILIGGALAVTSALVIWSRFSIERIARGKGKSLRQILRERRGGR
jgi:hypothetical protein